jgi:hypothetical protein
MNAIHYTRTLLRVGVFSMLVVGVTAACLVSFGKIPDEDYVPIVAVLIGSIPMVVFILKNKPICEKCQGVMKFKEGFPTIVYRCRGCGDLEDTGIHPVY